MFVRSVTFVDYVEIPNVKVEYSSNLYLYDIDEDGDIELIVGHWEQLEPNNLNANLIDSELETLDGFLTVIKYNDVICETQVNGIITCISAGKVLNDDKPYILVLCANSRCFCYSIVQNERTNYLTEIDGKFSLKLIHSQLIPPNSRSVLIDDIDNDGREEVVIASSDQCVRMFRFEATFDIESDEDDEFIKENGGYFVELLRWELPGLIGSIALHPFPPSDNQNFQGYQILASQPGNNFVVLEWSRDGALGYKGRTESQQQQQEKQTWFRYVGEQSGGKDPGSRNSEMHTFVVGNIRRSQNNLSINSGATANTSGGNIGSKYLEPYVAVCTAEGDLVLMEGEERIWQMRLGHGDLFGLCKIDVTKDEAQEVVVCSWDGSIYIIGHQRGIARFQRAPPLSTSFSSSTSGNNLPHNTSNSSQAFLAGLYTLAKGTKPQPVFIYGCFRWAGLQIYHSLHLNKISAHNLLQELSPTLKTKIRACGVDENDDGQVRRFVSSLLYKDGSPDTVQHTQSTYSNTASTVTTKSMSHNDDDDESSHVMNFYEPNPNHVHSPLIKSRSLCN